MGISHHFPAQARVYYFGDDAPLSSPRNASLLLATFAPDGFAGLGAGTKGGTLVSRVLPCRGQAPRVSAAVGGAGSVTAALLDGDARPLRGFSANEAQPVLLDAFDEPLAWTPDGPKDDIPRDCVLVLHLADATVFTFGFDRHAPGSSKRDAAERHFAEAAHVAGAELGGLAKLFSLLALTTLSCTALRALARKVAHCAVLREKRKVDDGGAGA